MRWPALLVACASAWLLASPAPAIGYTAGAAEVVSDGGADPTLSFLARPDEENNLVVTLSAGNYELTDAKPVTAGAGCAQVDPMKVSCPAAGIQDVRINVGRSDDGVTVNVPIPATVFGGDGSDTINTRDGVGDTVFCGTGTDPVVVADSLDVFPDGSCEQVDNGVPPDTTITSKPPDLSGSADATFEFSSSEPNSTFECNLDGNVTPDCHSPKAYSGLADGGHSFTVQAIDEFGNADQTPATRDWTIDTGAPNLNIDSGPSGTITTSSATFAFSSPDSDIDRFECDLDGSDWVACSSPTTFSFLPEGSHTVGIRVIDKTGNIGTLLRTFTVALPKPQPGPTANVSKPPSSLVLIAGKAVKISKRGFASVALNCSGTKECAGKLILATSKPVRATAKRRIVQLGAAKFQIPAGRTDKVKVRIPRKRMRLVRRLRRLSADVIVKDFDRAGRARTSARTIILKAPRR